MVATGEQFISILLDAIEVPTGAKERRSAIESESSNKISALRSHPEMFTVVLLIDVVETVCFKAGTLRK